MQRLLFALISVGSALLAGCSPLEVIKPYRMDIQQGNYLSQEMVSQLKVGMTKEQVRYVLGTPLVADIFHADRWDYVYYRDPRRGAREGRKIAVFFENGKLARVQGDVVAAEPQSEAPAPKEPAAAQPEPKPQAPQSVAEPPKPVAEAPKPAD
ncbi:MAG TPA: outer membrane protein assembly factor BamE [Burkholderiales bacterium]|nr:outer membrane protein assembly factor BamE [Burkholderiales bacterium]